MFIALKVAPANTFNLAPSCALLRRVFPTDVISNTLLALSRTSNIPVGGGTKLLVVASDI